MFLFTTVSRPSLGPTHPHIQWVPGALSLEIKRPGREADHSLLSSVAVKIATRYTSTPQRIFMVYQTKSHAELTSKGKSKVGAHPACCPMCAKGFFRWGKAAEAWSWPFTSMYGSGQECVELYRHSPNTPLWHKEQICYRPALTHTRITRQWRDR
jgi:hypothetical protein